MEHIGLRSGPRIDLIIFAPSHFVDFSQLSGLGWVTMRIGLFKHSRLRASPSTTTAARVKLPVLSERPHPGDVFWYSGNPPFSEISKRRLVGRNRTALNRRWAAVGFLSEY